MKIQLPMNYFALRSQVAVIYMCTRLIVNLTQVYTPLYLVDTLSLSKVCAYLPLSSLLPFSLLPLSSSPLPPLFLLPPPFLSSLLLPSLPVLSSV